MDLPESGNNIHADKHVQSFAMK